MGVVPNSWPISTRQVVNQKSIVLSLHDWSNYALHILQMFLHNKLANYRKKNLLKVEIIPECHSDTS